MIKLLVYYRPDSSTAREIESLTKMVGDECKSLDLGFMLGPLSYSLDPEKKKLSSDEKRYVVTETARKLTPLGADILKTEFPLAPENSDQTTWAAACADISAVSVSPWIFLSAAVDFETFQRQVRVACNTSASDIAVGRAVWKEAVEMTPGPRNDFQRTTAKNRLSQFSSLCTELGKPWQSYYPDLEHSIPEGWFAQYDS
ncbi:MAG: hypothetical protein MUO76_11005 [Anaerolineaceae bacterium]|nr:hypothetical protein [Anaerolineaceae bacterium]